MSEVAFEKLNYSVTNTLSLRLYIYTSRENVLIKIYTFCKSNLWYMHDSIQIYLRFSEYLIYHLYMSFECKWIRYIHLITFWIHQDIICNTTYLLTNILGAMCNKADLKKCNGMFLNSNEANFTFMKCRAFSI